MIPSATKEPDAGLDVGDNAFDLRLPELGDAESEMALGDTEFIAELSAPSAEWTEEEGAQEAIEMLAAIGDTDGMLDDEPFDAPEERALLAAEAIAEDAAVADAFAGEESGANGFQDRDFGPERPRPGGLAPDSSGAEAADDAVQLDDGGDGPQDETWLVEAPPAMLDDDGDDDEGAAETPPELAIPA